MVFSIAGIYRSKKQKNKEKALGRLFTVKELFHIKKTKGKKFFRIALVIPTFLMFCCPFSTS